MINKELESALNHQVAMEATASFTYLAMASWMENEGFEGTAKFLYAQSDEERMHMLKLFHYINEVGGYAIAPSVSSPEIKYENFAHVFQSILEQEEKVSASIHHLVSLSSTLNDHTTFNFLQWYVAEQREEEAQFRTIIDKLKILGKDGSGLYLLDRDLSTMVQQNTTKEAK
jgi:ferritin